MSSFDELRERMMIREDLMLRADPVPFDEDYYVIGEPTGDVPQPPDATDDREPMRQLQLSTDAPAPRFNPPWPGLVEFDVDWADEDPA